MTGSELTGEECEEIGRLFGYVPDPEPLNHMLDAVERIVAAHRASPHECEGQRQIGVLARMEGARANAAEAEVARLTAEREKVEDRLAETEEVHGSTLIDMADLRDHAEALDRANAALIEARDFQTARATKAEALVEAGLTLIRTEADKYDHPNQWVARDLLHSVANRVAALGGAK